MAQVRGVSRKCQLEGCGISRNSVSKEFQSRIVLGKNETMIILTVRAHGHQPQKTDIYRARARRTVEPRAVTAVLPSSCTNLSVMIG